MGLFRLFNGPEPPTPIPKHHFISDDLGMWEIHADYAKMGIDEGWLTLIHDYPNLYNEVVNVYSHNTKVTPE